MEQSIKILIADENSDFRRSCRSNLIGLGFKRIDEASNGEEALYKIDKKILNKRYLLEKYRLDNDYYDKVRF